MARWRDRTPAVFFGVSAVLLGGGVIAAVTGHDTAARLTWTAGTVLGLVLSVVWTAEAVRQRSPTVDIIAVLALAGTLWVDEAFAGAMVTLMLASGRLLEARAAARARRELGLLVQRTPRTARLRAGSTLTEVDVEDVVRGDHLVVGTGEVVPVDGRLLGVGTFDESALTGEPMPVERPDGDEVRSGVVNAGPPVDLVATTVAADSTYAGVVRLVEQAQASSAPFVRVADRIAVYFVPLAVAVAGLAWAMSGSTVTAVAVLVVATPCPLLLAAPVAIMSGLSRSARVGVVVKGGAALESLAAGRVMLFDKTGTLTRGQPALAEIVTAVPDGDGDEVLRLAASLDQVSPHPLASALVGAARRRGLDLDLPSAVQEVHGYGLEGRVGAHDVRIGKASWVVGPAVPDWLRRVRRRASLDGTLTVFVAVDGRAAGAFLLDDPIRSDAPRMIRALRDAGITRTVLVTGDRADVAETVGRIVGVDAVLADCDPVDKLAAVRAESVDARTIMVGDGINDAPALAAAGVGVALAARGATASSEAADIVLTVDRVDALADAILIARRSRTIALQAVVVGMGLSLAAMVMAALGLLPPAAGAVLQEGIDVIALLIALRAVLPGRTHSIAMSEDDIATAQRLRVDHDAAAAAVEGIRAVADALTTRDTTIGPVVALLGRLEHDVLPHERADEELLMPLVARALGGSATATMSRTHAEIEHQVSRLRRLVDELDAGEVQPEDVVELRQILYGLYAVCRLHNRQEEEGAFALVPSSRSQASGDR